MKRFFLLLMAMISFSSLVAYGQDTSQKPVEEEKDPQGFCTICDDFDDEIKPEEIDENHVYYEVDVMPSFRGGDLNTFRMWFAREFKIPRIAAKKGI